MHFGDWKKASKLIDGSIRKCPLSIPSSSGLVVLDVSSSEVSDDGGRNESRGEEGGVVSGLGNGNAALAAAAAAAAAILWMDLGDMVVSGS